MKRLDEWKAFAEEVESHISHYTQMQYGDAGSEKDQIDKLTPEDCVKHIRKYLARLGSNARGQGEQLRDMLKIAHYAQIAHTKMLLLQEETQQQIVITVPSGGDAQGLLDCISQYLESKGQKVNLT
jgi:hypothetical protein